MPLKRTLKKMGIQNTLTGSAPWKGFNAAQWRSPAAWSKRYSLSPQKRCMSGVDPSPASAAPREMSWWKCRRSVFVLPEQRLRASCSKAQLQTTKFTCAISTIRRRGSHAESGCDRGTDPFTVQRQCLDKNRDQHAPDHHEGTTRKAEPVRRDPIRRMVNAEREPC